jgi:phosphoribosylglycinamide formyltransferase
MGEQSPNRVLPRVVVFASGDAEPGHGGSGLRKLLEATHAEPRRLLRAEIVGVVSNHAAGGVHDIAHEYGIPFVHMPAPYDAASYQAIMQRFDAKWAALSGWIKMVRGLDPGHTFNIHPAPIPQFGGYGYYGLKPHREVVAAFKRGEVTHTAVVMHFVIDEPDAGPVCFWMPIQCKVDETPEQLQRRVNAYEHAWQAAITDMIVNEEIRWDGDREHPVRVPVGYRLRGFCPESCVSIAS